MTAETRRKLQERTRIIIRTEEGYLVRVTRIGSEGIDPVWSHSPYDAWFTRNRRIAWMIARRLHGKTVMFNPIVGQIREMR